MAETIKNFDLSGQWLPSIDPLKIGPQDFSVLKNYRYNANGIERVEGNSKINTTALATYLKGRSGIQLKSPYTTKSRVIAQLYDSNLENPVIKENTTPIPDQGDFSSSTVETVAIGSGQGRFDEFPNSHIAYCNEAESCVWAGDEMRIAAFILSSSVGAALSPSNPVDYSFELSNTLQSSGNTVSISGANLEFLVASTRPLKGVRFYVSGANTTASTLTGYEWDGSAWSAVANPSDGTSFSGKAFARTGTYSFDSTINSSSAAIIEGYYLYFYKFVLSAGSATIYHVTVDAPFQPIVDIWDGVYRTCIQFQLSRNSIYEDYTLEINEPSSVQYPIVGMLGGITSSDSLVLVFEDRMAGFNWSLLAGYTNNKASSATIKYWNGSAWTTVGTVNDRTAVSSKSLNQSGIMSWTPPSESLEKPRSIFGVYGYAYQITWSATLNGKKAVGTHTGGNNEAVLEDSTQEWTANELIGKTANNTTDGSSAPITANTDQTVTGTLSGGTEDDWDTDDAYTITPFYEGVSVDTLFGIPAQKKIRPFKFPFMYKNRPMLCGDIAGKEENRIDFGARNTTDVHNGDDSSQNGQSLYIGSGGELTGASRIYNRFGSNILDTALFFKTTETHLLHGDDPSDFKLYQISKNYGCPAPLTIDTAEVAYEIAQGELRNVGIWLSHQGPILFDAAVIIPIPGIEKYFDQRKSSCINFNAISNACGVFDPTNMEYNLCLPSGSGQTSCNVWLVLDVARKKWYEKDVTNGSCPQAFIKVDDLDGKKYIYGLIDSGYLIRIEDGTTWAEGGTIEYTVGGQDFFPFDSPWIQSRIKQFKLLTQVPAFEDQAANSSITISINHYKDGETDPTPLTDITISKSDYMVEKFLVNEDDDRLVNEDGNFIVANIFNEKRHYRNTQGVSLLGWSHRFEISQDSDSYDYIENYSRNVLGYSVKVEDVREDL